MQSKLSLVLTSFLFGFMLLLFPMTANAETSETITFYSQSTSIDLPYEAESATGYFRFPAMDVVKTFVFEESFYTAEEEGTDHFYDSFSVYFDTLPSVNASWVSGSTYGDTEVVDTRVYLVIGGEKYLVTTAQSAMLVDGGFSDIAVRVETDIRFYSGTHAVTSLDYTNSHYEVEIECSDADITLDYFYISDSGFLQALLDVNTNLHTQVQAFRTEVYTKITDLQNTLVTQFFTLRTELGTLLNTLHNNLTTNLGSWFDRQYTSLIEQFYTLRSELGTLLNSLHTKLTMNLTTWFDRQHQDMLDLGDKLTNSYDTTDSDKITSDFGTSVGNFEKAESELTDEAINNLGAFTIPENGIAYYGSQTQLALSLVSSMMQSVFISMGDFNIIISVGFGIVIVSMLLGLYKFFT